MLPLLLALPPLGAWPPPSHGAACEVALLHTSILLEEIKNFEGSDRITFAGGDHMPYLGNRESWWLDSKPAIAPDNALFSRVRKTSQPSAVPTCETLASLLTDRGVQFREAFPRDTRSVVKLTIRVSLPAMSKDGRSAILLDSVGSTSGGSSGRVCYYQLTATSTWKRAGCTSAWIAD